MKKVSMAAAALALTSLFASSAMAKDVDIKACTKDGQTAVMHVDVEGSISSGPTFRGIPKAPTRSFESIVQEAFTNAARSLTATQLVGQEGAVAFGKNLREAMQGKKLSDDIKLQRSGPPTILAGAPACSITPAP